MTKLKMPAGLHSACGVRDRPVAVAALPAGMQVVRLAVPAVASNSQRGAAGILSAVWHLRPGGHAAPGGGGPGPGVGDGSVTAGTGSSRVRGGASPGVLSAAALMCRIRTIVSNHTPPTCGVPLVGNAALLAFGMIMCNRRGTRGSGTTCQAGCWRPVNAVTGSYPLSSGPRR